jgi:hypothetical protein
MLLNNWPIGFCKRTVIAGQAIPIPSNNGNIFDYYDRLTTVCFWSSTTTCCGNAFNHVVMEMSRF